MMADVTMVRVVGFAPTIPCQDGGFRDCPTRRQQQF